MSSNQIQVSSAIEAALIQGDISKLSGEQRIAYYKAMCDSLGLNPMTQPFSYLRLNGKDVLYANKCATDQLRKIHGVSIHKLETQVVEGICVVTACARDKDGKEDSEVGAVDIKGLTGEKLANAMMKASTKAKRRVTLSICGLGMLDESEVDSIPGAQRVQEPNVVEQRPAEQGTSKATMLMAVAKPAEPAQFEYSAEKDPGLYVLTFGKYRGRNLADIDIYELNNYRQWLGKQANPGPMTNEAIDAMDAYLATRDVSKRAK